MRLSPHAKPSKRLHKGSLKSAEFEKDTDVTKIDTVNAAMAQAPYFALTPSMIAKLRQAEKQPQKPASKDA